MNSMEEQLWEYIDGGGTPVQRAEMEHLIAADGKLKQQYEELLQLHTDFGNIEADEPPMAFTYNVMEAIRTQQAAVPLKAGINSRIIWGIAAFFIVTLGALLVVLLSQINWNTGGNEVSLPKIRLVNDQRVNEVFSSPLMKGFWFLDVVFALFLFDAWLRRRKNRQEDQHAIQ